MNKLKEGKCYSVLSKGNFRGGYLRVIEGSKTLQIIDGIKGYFIKEVSLSEEDVIRISTRATEISEKEFEVVLTLYA